MTKQVHPDLKGTSLCFLRNQPRGQLRPTPAATGDAPTANALNRSYLLAVQLVEAGHRVAATARTPEKASALQELAAQHPNLTLITLDVLDSESVEVSRNLGSAMLTLELHQFSRRLCCGMQCILTGLSAVCRHLPSKWGSCFQADWMSSSTMQAWPVQWCPRQNRECCSV